MSILKAKLNQHQIWHSQQLLQSNYYYLDRRVIMTWIHPNLKMIRRLFLRCSVCSFYSDSCTLLKKIWQSYIFNNESKKVEHFNRNWNQVWYKLKILCTSCNYYLDRCLIRTSIHPTLNNDYKIILRNFSVLSTQTAATLSRQFDRVTFLTMKAKILKF